MNDTFSPAGQPVQVDRDLVYGEAPVGHGTPQAGLKPLRLDLYRPAVDGAPAGGRPALILSHGGAYHRGSKEEDLFEQDGCRNTAMAEYAQRFAARGFVCVSVGYRLAQELPAPQAQPIKRERSGINRDRIDYVRQLMGLPPATDADLLNAAEGAIEDVVAAFRFVQANAAAWGVDPQRIVLGGFSAGAFASVYAAYALGMPAAAVVALSGGMDAADAAHYLHDGRGQPPLLAYVGEHDLPAIPERTQALLQHADRCGVPTRCYTVPARPHFYDRSSPVVLAQGTLPGAPERGTVESVLTAFLDQVLQPVTVSTATLDAFAQAWNRHDIDALMSHMTDDCVFHTSAGAQACGTSHVGREAVRAAFQRAWADFPDAQWTRAVHWVAGHRGASEWTFTGTRARDGVRVVVDGCDLFSFRGDKIRVKDSWRKQLT